MILRRTIEKEVTVVGIGLHTGESVKLIFCPAESNFGIRFQRMDLDGKPEFPADLRYVSSTNRGTTLSDREAFVRTVEHVLAAVYGLGIDDLLIQLEGPEMPVLDGSSKPFVEALQAAGIKDLDVDKEYLEIEEVIQFDHPETGSEYIIMPSDEFALQVLVDFNTTGVNKQFAEMTGLEEFATSIAPARTFGFFSEIESLLERDLAKGGDLTNAIVIADRPVSQEELDAFSLKMGTGPLSISSEGILNNTPLRFNNELARHKLLDLMGDLALVGRWFKARIIATRPGHQSNNEFARALRQVMKKAALQKKIPVYNPNLPALLDINEVKRRLPHRYPFLLVDKVISMDEKSVVGIKNVTTNEPFFTGHFPDEPVMPGVLLIEAAAQAGGMLVLGTVPDPENYSTYFLKIDKVKFKQKVVPGDTLILKVDLLEPIRRGIAIVFAEIFVGNKLVMEGELMAQIVKTKPDD